MSAQPLPTGRLTTHVLDTARGSPAAGMVIELTRIEGLDHQLVKTVSTNADGRVDGPLLAGVELERGVYELRFHAGDYLRSTGDDLGLRLFDLSRQLRRFRLYDGRLRVGGGTAGSRKSKSRVAVHPCSRDFISDPLKNRC